MWPYTSYKSRPSRLGGAAQLLSILVLGAALTLPSVASAQEVVLPREGMQWFAAGLSLNPGLFFERDTERFPSQDAITAAGGGTIRLGLHQLLKRNLVISAEAEIGAQWLDDHTATTQDVRDSTMDLAWQIGVIPRWLPMGDRHGFSIGLGAHFYRMALEDTPLQILGADARVGHYFWQEDEGFLLVEVGYAFPVIQGLTLPPDFDGTRGPVDRTWSFHRFSVGFQYGF